MFVARILGQLRSLGVTEVIVEIVHLERRRDGGMEGRIGEEGWREGGIGMYKYIVIQSFSVYIYIFF